MSIYNELDQIIADYVGYKEETFECNDPVLYDNITDELRRYIDRAFPIEYLSKDAQFCLTEWESLVQLEQQYHERIN
jgi:hypothetical protein